MATEKQIAANRANAQRSTGPRSPEGKSKSRRNAYKHGLAGSSGEVLDREMQDEVEGELASFRKRLRPQDPVEGRLVELMAFASIRLNRCHAAAESLTREHRRHALRHWDEARDAEVAAAGLLMTSDPRSALATLERTAEGCDYLGDRWDELRTRLEAAGHWTLLESDRAARLLGEPGVISCQSPDRPALMTLCVLALLPQPKPAVVSRYFGDAPDAADRVPDRAEARATLVRIVDEEMARLADLGDRLWASYDGPDRAATLTQSLSPTDPESHRLKSYTSSSASLLLRARAALSAHRAEDRRDRAEPSTPRPARNEPNFTPRVVVTAPPQTPAVAAEPSIGEPPTREVPVVRNEPNEPDAGPTPMGSAPPRRDTALPDRGPVTPGG